MDNFSKLNELILYIEDNLDKEIDIKHLAQILCVNTYTLYRIFMFVTGISLTEYIRNRRLSMAGIELFNSNPRIIDLALKYGYNSADGFSRAFSKFHGISPTLVKKNSNYLKNYPPYSFSSIKLNKELHYKIIHYDSFKLNCMGFECKIPDIHILAPKYWNELKNEDKYSPIFNNTYYGIIKYDKLFPHSINANYYVGSKIDFKNSTELIIPESDWVVFDIEQPSGDYFYQFSQYVYTNWIPFSGYSIKNIPEIEVYNVNSTTQWWLPIEKSR